MLPPKFGPSKMVQVYALCTLLRILEDLCLVMTSHWLPQELSTYT